MPELNLNAISVGDPRWHVYFFTVSDAPGVVAANNFLTVFNPPTSGKLHIALGGLVTNYSTGTSATPNSLQTRRLTAASAGSLVTASQVDRFVSGDPDPKTEVRTGNPTTTELTGQPMSAFPPPISTGAGDNGFSNSPPPGASFLVLPGEGITFKTTAGNINQVWNITYLWAEVGIDAVKG